MRVDHDQSDLKTEPKAMFSNHLGVINSHKKVLK